MEFFTKTPDQQQQVLGNLSAFPWPSDDADRPAQMLERCPAAAETPLTRAEALARRAGVGEVLVKDERGRMGLGSFKALGAAYVIAHDAANGGARGSTYVTASAGNHGMSVAAGAAAFGARSVIYIAETVPETFAERLRAQGAEVRREGAIYEDSMAAAAAAAEKEGLILLSDSSWPDYTDRPHRLMEGYLVLMREAVAQMSRPPTHLFLQAGVGGLAAAAAVHARRFWGTAPRIVVVEPDRAPALFGSILAGRPTETPGPASDMGRLDCKEPSWIALKGLARDADMFMTITENEGQAGADACAGAGLPTTTSGGAGVSGLLAAAAGDRDAFGLDAASRVMVILSEAAAA